MFILLLKCKLHANKLKAFHCLRFNNNETLLFIVLILSQNFQFLLLSIKFPEVINRKFLII